MASAPIRPYAPRNPGPPTDAERRIIDRILLRHGYPLARPGAGNAGRLPPRSW
jgi:hypothetical protein